MPIIDFHNHFYPAEYLRAVMDGPSSLRSRTDAEGNPVLYYPGDYNVVVPGHRDIDVRTQHLDRAGVAKQVLTFTSPGVHVEEPALAVELAGQVNDALARIVRERGDRYTALATLPLNDPPASAREVARARDELDFRGFMVFSNVNGTALSDPAYEPMWSEANSSDAVVYIHPIHPVGVEAMTDYWLMPLLGFPFDTTLAAAKLVFSGVVERYPRIRWVLAHLGGTIPYLAERLDRGFEAFEECRQHIERYPSSYLRQFYYDTVNFDPAALRLAIGFAGVDHVLAGSDYPHKIGSLERMVSSIDALDLPEADKEQIRSGNCARLLGPRPPATEPS